MTPEQYDMFLTIGVTLFIFTWLGFMFFLFFLIRRWFLKKPANKYIYMPITDDIIEVSVIKTVRAVSYRELRNNTDMWKVIVELNNGITSIPLEIKAHNYSDALTIRNIIIKRMDVNPSSVQ